MYFQSHFINRDYLMLNYSRTSLYNPVCAIAAHDVITVSAKLTNDGLSLAINNALFPLCNCANTAECYGSDRLQALSRDTSSDWQKWCVHCFRHCIFGNTLQEKQILIPLAFSVCLTPFSCTNKAQIQDIFIRCNLQCLNTLVQAILGSRAGLLSSFLAIVILQHLLIWWQGIHS